MVLTRINKIIINLKIPIKIDKLSLMYILADFIIEKHEFINPLLQITKIK